MRTKPPGKTPHQVAGTMPGRGHWLIKSEPGVFSFDDLVAAPGQTTGWDGVRN